MGLAKPISGICGVRAYFFLLSPSTSAQGGVEDLTVEMPLPDEADFGVSVL